MAVYKSLNINIGTLKGNPEMLKFVLIILKPKRYVSMQLPICFICYDVFLANVRLKKCVINLFQKRLEHYNLVLAVAEIKKCVIKPLVIILMRWNLFLNAGKHIHCVITLLILILLHSDFFLNSL